ncbi:MAG: patatin-like phospholipase family protein [Hyphomicrobium sp.]|uniref:patatin-like phospholipase family protein n=1 Tax=Hyphomicrobium sp. TaxID=82 RepID=UPI0013220992|nr:patatin-like phospholipase family protein [Hyphomicrobium sp.]KAB2940183.1 MAG: patatin-like phospholipase family protein [Hyphomicrobium sp.]MBZ0210473.1 patatin-like phospholipase family protein [Hyphomicrobium sp.]
MRHEASLNRPKAGNGTKQTHATDEHGRIVVVLQGGGALGAYQAGVYEALHEAGIEPDWMIGTSIGAINAALIAGNERDNRVPALREFWRRMAHKSIWHEWAAWPRFVQSASYLTTLTAGLPGFFVPNPLAFLGPHVRLGSDNAGFYSTAPLEKTLSELLDFSLISRNKPRLTVGAAHVRTSRMRYFDSRNEELSVKHILASGALPPAFPAVRIDGELYWDGGILSNTPAEAIFDDNPRVNSLVFAVHMWNPQGPEPETIWEVLHRQKDIQYSSRVATHIARQAQIHRLRHIIRELAALLPDEARRSTAVKELTTYGCLTRMHIVRLLWPGHDTEDHTKDVDFSPSGIRKRWAAGYEKTMRVIEGAPWTGTFDPIEGVYLHELIEEEQMEPAAGPMMVEARASLALDDAAARLQGGACSVSARDAATRAAHMK